MNTQLKVTAEEVGQRLDIFLTAKINGVSRSRLQKLVKDGSVTVNGKAVTPHLALREDDIVSYPDDAAAPPAALVPRPDLPLDIVHEDPNVLVINKPTGQLVHPAAGETDTLANALLGHYPDIAAVGESPDRPGIVHRLDKDASGLLVVAKSQEAFDGLKRQFQAHEVTKEYVVLVAGRPPEDEGTVELAIGRSSGGGKMAAHVTPQEGDREAVTHYRVEEEVPGASLLSVSTETGRTHQIRVHLNAIGCPVAGDTLYGLKSKSRINAPRLFLHCRRLAFTHPTTKKPLEFTSPLPPDLADYLAKQRGQDNNSR